MSDSSLTKTAVPADQQIPLGELLESSVEEVFLRMLPLTILYSKSLRRLAGEQRHSLSAVLGLSGEMRGVLVIHCPQKVACALASAMLFCPLETVGPEVKDCLGELGNMVAGGIKTRLLDYGREIELSIPSLIGGEHYGLNFLSQADWLAMVFSTEVGEFVVELNCTL